MVDKVEMIPDQGEQTGVTVGGPIEMPNIQAGPVKLEVPKGYKPFVQPESAVPQGFKPVATESAPALTEDPDIVGDRIEKVRTYFGRIEGTRPHVGADAQNLTLPFGIVPDSVMVNGQEVRAGANTLGNDVLEANPDQVQLMTATKKVGNTTYKASDYNNYMEFSDAVLGAFEQELVAQMPDLPEDALPTMLSSMWNVGVNSGMQNWSGFKATVAELKKPEGSRDMYALVSMGKHSFTGGRPSVGLLKRRMEDLNLSLPPSEQIAKVSQKTVNGKPVMEVYDREGNVIRTFNFNKASINSDQTIDLEIDDLPTVEDTPKGGRGSEGDMQEPVQEEVQSEPQPKQEQLGDGFYEMEDGTTVRVEGGRMYDVRTGERLDADAVTTPGAGEDVGTIENGREVDAMGLEKPTAFDYGWAIGEGVGLSRDASRKIGELFNTVGSVGDLFVEMSPQGDINAVQRGAEAIEQDDTLTAVVEFGSVAPVVGDIGKAIFIGAKARGVERVAGNVKRAKLDDAIDMIRAGDDPELVRQATNWHMGADGKWRFELDDSKVQMKIGERGGNWLTPEKSLDLPIVETSGNLKGAGTPLDQVIDHPELFDAYPWLKDYTVVGYNASDKYAGSALGFARAEQNAIGIRVDATPEQAKSTMLHEIQHMIQAYEGFVRGNNISRFLREDTMREFTRAAGDAKRSIVQNTSLKEEDLTDGMTASLSAYIVKGEEGLDQLFEGWEAVGKEVPNPDMLRQRAKVLGEYLQKNQPDLFAQVRSDTMDFMNIYMGEYIPAFVKYKRTLGEVEARNVQARMKYSMDERMLTSPQASQDVPVGTETDVRGNVL